MQWSSYDDSFDQFQKWLAEAATKVKVDAAVKATLQEKKVQLQSHKVTPPGVYKIACLYK